MYNTQSWGIVAGDEMDLTCNSNWKKEMEGMRMKEIVCLCFLFRFL